MAGFGVITKEPPKSHSSPSSGHKHKQEKKIPFSAPTELQMDQKDNCGFWEGEDLVIPHQCYLFQLSPSYLDETLLRRGCHKLGTGILMGVGWCQHREQQEQAGDAERGDQRSL